ncbi:MAG TPA: NADH-quinone oxidoreductase subunit L, partial [Planctomycetota bacterium]|nr:NADH-quinone oxidoreductase subunit L [Planctomycetota bacterium]
MDSLWLLPLLPLLGSAVCGVLHARTLAARRASPEADPHGTLAGGLASLTVGVGFLVACAGFLRLLGLPADARVLDSSTWHWIDAGSLAIDVTLRLDPLSSVMTLVVTGVGLLIHVYSIGYMKGDPGFAKFFAYLNLFVSAMLMLVLSSDLLGLFIGWEGVGLCSYLLIGYWYAKERGWPAEAGQKAFVMNRIGDACLLVGSFLLVRLFGTLDLAEINASVAGLLEDPDAKRQMALAALLLFGGACGKSAQIPLFTWLPDAMAGPTSVSALIHAATMVTAGVYLCVRMGALFAVETWVLAVVGIVGAATALVGATTAFQQKDIKKVLAYSTVSQLGYMFLGVAAGAWYPAIFHLVTHAFFKGLLFLGSGSVIHGMHGEQDMTRMGGLKRHMPTTWWTFMVGSFALAGLPFLSGFFSKDEILLFAFTQGTHGSTLFLALWAVGLLSAAMTAFYTARMVALTFYGEERFDAQHVHPHESPSTMTVPLGILACLAAGGGLLGVPAVVAHGDLHALKGFLEPVYAPADAVLAAARHGHLPHASLAA